MRWILGLRVFIIISLAVLLITTAVVFSTVRAVLPYATGYKLEIQQEISQQIGLPVEIDSIDAELYWFTPRLKLIEVVVYDESHVTPLFDFKEAFVGLDVLASIMRLEIIIEDIGLIDADISIEKLSDSEWLIQGIKFTSEGSDEVPEQLLYMIKNSDYLVHHSNIYYQDHTGEKLSLKLLDVNIDVKNNYGNHDIKFSMNLPEAYGEYLAVVANLQGDLEDLEGDIFVEARKINVDQWKKKFMVLEKFSLSAILDADLWATLDESQIKSLTAHFSSEKTFIRNEITNRSWSTDYLNTDVRYLHEGERWNIAVSDFYFGARSKPQWPQSVTAIAGDDGESYFLSADMLRYTDVKNIAGVFLEDDHLEQLDSLNDYQIEGDVYNLALQMPKARVDKSNTETTEAEKTHFKKVQAKKVQTQKPLAKKPQTDKTAPAGKLPEGLTLAATVNNLAFTEPGSGLKLNGFDGSISIDKGEIDADVATSDAVVTYAEMFREPIIAKDLRGIVKVKQHEGSWRISSDRTQLGNDHIQTFSRFDLRLSAENKIFIDAQTNFYDGYGKFARHYLPVGIMSQKLVDWLDASITSGHVPAGTMLLHGNLDDFPYKDNSGIFEVLFSAEKVDMQFLAGWPRLEATSGRIKFNNQSMYLDNAKGSTKKTSLYDGHAEILDLTRPLLTVKTKARGLNEDVQQYVWQSPLDDIFGNALRLFQLEGDSELTLDMDIPLDNAADGMVIDGQLNFINSSLYYPTLAYELKEVNGVIDFTRDSIFADSIKAKIQGSPVQINASTQNGKSGQEVIFHLDGPIPADYLLQRYDWIPEDWIKGQSIWSIDIAAPKKVEDYLVHIQASSYLEGVELRMSDKVNKAANDRLAFTASIDVLHGNGMQVEAVVGATPENQVKGGASKHAAAGTGAAGRKINTGLVNLFAERDEKNVWAFDIRSDYITGKGGFAEGLPRDSQVTLDMETVDVHALFVSKGKKSSKPLNASTFPPLQWNASKVIWDDWVFSDVVLVTSWNEYGMLINRLSLKGDEMNFDASGTWLTSWSGAHETVLRGDIVSTNVGVTLSGLGFQRSIDRASYKAGFNAKWAAEPYGFSWANLKGKTTFEMRDGEILEVDPGAGGRLLGLLNLFRLTSRLTLDFDDVYRKGYSFDTINGEFEFVDGNGSMKKFEVSAPAADMSMFGRIGMVKHDYGLLIRVKPHTDTLTFAGGALLGGVVVGAGLAIIQKVFDLSVIGHNVYSVTGTWEQPVIEKIVAKAVSTSEEDEF